MKSRRPLNIPAQRLHNQHITRPRGGSPSDLVAHLGAVQAQEYPFAKWALALRLGEATAPSRIDEALAEGRILRTHVLRPTWHFVAAADIEWMLELTAPRVHRALASYTRNQGLDARRLTRALDVIARGLAGDRHLTRAELRDELARARIALTPIQLGLVCMYAELERVICSGRRRGKQATYALLSERVPRGVKHAVTGDEALAELTRRFFQSHGPATIRDFVWWSGLKTADARRGVDMIQATAIQPGDGLTYWSIGGAPVNGAGRKAVHLLPIYDEYLVAYRDRAAVPHGPRTVQAGSKAIPFRHSIIVGGQVVGTWTVGADGRVQVIPLRPLARREQRSIDEAAQRYLRFATAGAL